MTLTPATSSIRLYQPKPYPQSIIAPEESPPDPATAPTLRELFEDVIEKELKKNKRASKTFEDYEALINDWERLTENPPLSQIDTDFLEEFRDDLLNEVIDFKSGKKRSVATINKKFRTLHYIVKRCFPPDRHNLQGLSICNYFALLEPLTEIDRIPRTYTWNQLDQLYLNSHRMQWPGENAELVWQTIFVMGYVTGPRTFDLLGLQKEDIDWNFCTYKGCAIASIKFVSRKRKKLQRLPLHPIAALHLKELCKVIPGDQVFPGFQYSNKNWVYNRWDLLKGFAEIPAEYKLEDLRKTCNTAYEDRWRGVGEFMLGHSLNGVNARNYYNPTKKVIHASQNLKLPKSFYSVEQRGLQPQLPFTG